jgi:hypothetical protein
MVKRGTSLGRFRYLRISNPFKILKTLDSHLEEPIDLVVYGKSAICLLFPEDEKIGVTNDLDLIIPETKISVFDKRLDFWDAVEKTNKELEHLGLYLSHIFDEHQIILHPDWFNSKIEIESILFNNLSVFTPNPLDLIITKMMRVDPQDRNDIRFIFEKACIQEKDLLQRIEGAICPDVAEIKDAFFQNVAWFKGEKMK